MPRFAMYSFYARFFDFAYGILNAAILLKNNEIPVRPASVVMDNPIQGFPLAQRMKDVLLYAPLCTKRIFRMRLNTPCLSADSQKCL